MELTDRERDKVVQAINDAIVEIAELGYYENFVDGHPGVTDSVMAQLDKALEILGE